jgi:hypothetical protein
MKKLVAVVLGFSVLAVVNAEAAPQKKANARGEAAPAWRNNMNAAGGHQRMAGCGLGSMLVKENNTWSQVLASLLNGTGGQSFAISTGTSNCTEDGVTNAAREKEAFMEVNYAELKRDIAVGNGEYVSSLASLYGCKGEAANGFAKALKSNSGSLLQKNSQESLVEINQIVSSDAALAGACQG